MMSQYDVVIILPGRNPIIGETTTVLAQAKKRLKYEMKIGDGRIVDIVKDGGLIMSSHPERLVS